MTRATGAFRSWGVVVAWPEDGWRGLSGRQQVGLVVRGVAQGGLLVVAARDLRRRPPDQVRGRKWLWVPVIAMNYLGVGPIAYLIGGRRRGSDAAADAATSSDAAVAPVRAAAAVASSSQHTTAT